ncbi:type II secretion system F family protein [Phycisphaera mikurensis]|uniref:Type IV pilus assembly protein PilC n=1 Tax=Phycisphaera mikurensis (strain NBRC 102666 / KCTC 22515 / FYK2301M01) TaxID=1142394 RepID=I0II80_PHYMF|nr:type II secretion system F family protein [Phycisphaera mikurensis]MBB6442469.1 type II secretory pathway component PulF [Phycisphaera mikurensis]BAM04968.1 type IV pilus assembly protein PilC [Phycisphaera mikurensis NBRC 102666]
MSGVPGIVLEPPVAPAGAPPRAAGRLTPAQRFGRRRQLLLFVRQLQLLLSAGTPLLQSLDALRRQTADPLWERTVAELAESIEGGSSLSGAMGRRPELFPAVSRGLVAAGESTGRLGDMLERVAGLIQKDLQVRSAVIAALAYPLALLAVVTAVGVSMLLFVVPRFAGLFETLNVPMPPTTQITVWTSQTLRDQGLWIGGGLAAAATAGFLLVRSPAGRLALDATLLRVPGLGPVIKGLATAQIVRLFGVLTDCHLPLMEVLALVRGSCGNARYRALLDAAETSVDRGEGVSAAFDDPDLIAPSVYEAFRSAESSGRLGPAMVAVAEFLEQENDALVRLLTKTLEPVILLLLGLVVGALAMSMFLPLFDLTAMAGGGGS